MQKTGFGQALYRQLASLKLTVFVFFALAASSVVGTLLPQGAATPAELSTRYGPAGVRIITTLGLNDLYHSGWFQLLILLLCVNLIVCTFERLPKAWRLARHQEDHIDPQKLVKFGRHRQITSNMGEDELRNRLETEITQRFARFQWIGRESGGSGGIAEAGRWSPFMVYVVHLSVVVVLLGAIAGSLFGFKGFMNIVEGSTDDEVILADGKQTIKLPFQIRCDKFDIAYYDNGMPKEFRSDLTLLKDGKELLKREIRVNDPLTYEGITFYQASYDYLMEARLEIRNKTTNEVSKLQLPYKEWATVPGTGDRMLFMALRTEKQEGGPAVALLVSIEGKKPSGVWISPGDPDFRDDVAPAYSVRVPGVDKVPYTGLQVKQDPGIWLVWLGFSAMIIGIGLTFYVSRRKIWVWAAPHPSKKGTSTVIVAGRTNRNEQAFERDFEELCDHLQQVLKPSTKGR